jgi:hypothetical protein
MTALPFTTSIVFALAVEAFGVCVRRKARVDYAFSPAWPYRDSQSGEACIGLSVLT